MRDPRSPHKPPETIRLPEEADGRVRFLPPDSPNRNPIESLILKTTRPKH